MVTDMKYIAFFGERYSLLALMYRIGFRYTLINRNTCTFACDRFPGTRFQIIHVQTLQQAFGVQWDGVLIASTSATSLAGVDYVRRCIAERPQARVLSA